MPLRLTVHRGSNQIGGSCVEVVHPDGARLILDAGRPLDAPATTAGLLPATLDRTRPATVLVGHPHQDHYGLLCEVPAAWDVWTGTASAKLIALTKEISGKPPLRTLSTWTSGTGSIRIGPFTVTPILTDHSAFDAYMLLVEGAGRRVLYTGDFRRYGRKGKLVDAVIARPPRDIDVLVCEGTNLGTGKPVIAEDALEGDCVELFKRTAGRVFVAWSGQNIDRTVTLYRAALRTGRLLVVDLYVADVMDRISSGTRLPRAGFRGLKVVVTRGLRRHYARRGADEFVARMATHGVAARFMRPKAIVVMRRSLIRDFENAGVFPTPADAFVHSMWRASASMASARIWNAARQISSLFSALKNVSTIALS